jgi:trehalose 6-phosphate synthase/phosphatase
MREPENVTRLTDQRPPGRLLVVSNRLPVVIHKSKDSGAWTSEIGSGGLVSALMPVLRDRGGMWVGWPGVLDSPADIDDYLDSLSGETGYGLRGVHLDSGEIEGFYEGFSNEIIWPLFHDLPVDGRFDPGHWEAYRKVNRKFAKHVAQVRKPGDVIWVHDYHLVGVGAVLRRLGVSERIGFFLHIPFPPPDLFMKLPWRGEMLSGLLEYDLVGFQTMRDMRNFLRCLRAMYQLKIKGDGQVKKLTAVPLSAELGDADIRTLRVGSFPISIDFRHYEALARSPATGTRLEELRRQKGDLRVILSVDRLDYTKGLLAKLDAFALALERYPSLRKATVLSMHVIPSRENIRDYRRLHEDVEQLVSKINGAWSRPGWIPVHYYYRSLPSEELSAYYRRANIMLVSPLKDGMNLVAKEYCASHPDNDGVLILSEFAGAAAELQRGALLVNPYDIERVAERIYQATTLGTDEISQRMEAMRGQIRHHDIFAWVNAYLNAIAGRALDDFPRIPDYVPGLPPEELAAGL